MLTFFFSGADGKMTCTQTLTTGMIGSQIRLEFSPEWEGLLKTAVYQAGDTRVTHVGVGDRDTIPAEVLQQPMERLLVGVYGVSEDGVRVIPTIRVQGPVILPGVQSDAEQALDPALPVWAQLQQMIGDLEKLETEHTGSLVEAINAAALTGDGESGATFLPQVDGEGYLSWTNDRGLANPVAVNIRGAVGPKGDMGPQGPAGPAGSPDFEGILRSIALRGYSSIAPENTIPAIILAKQQGFGGVQCDVRFTSDEVAVLLQDPSVDRTSNGTGKISDMTYLEAFSLDFGSWKSPEYAGTKIATLEDLLIRCKHIGLNPYLMLKNDLIYSQEQINSLVSLTQRYGMAERVTWVSDIPACLTYVKNADSTARLGYWVSAVNQSVINAVHALETGENTVFLDVTCLSLTVSSVSLCISEQIPLEVWNVIDQQTLLGLDPYISGVTSETLLAGQILQENGMQYAVSD